MKAAAVVVSILSWGGFLGALWYALVAPVRPPVGLLLGVLVASFLVGTVIPAYLLGIEERARNPRDSRGRTAARRPERAGRDEQ